MIDDSETNAILAAARAQRRQTLFAAALLIALGTLPLLHAAAHAHWVRLGLFIGGDVLLVALFVLGLRITRRSAPALRALIEDPGAIIALEVRATTITAYVARWSYTVLRPPGDPVVFARALRDRCRNAAEGRPR